MMRYDGSVDRCHGRHAIGPFGLCIQPVKGPWQRTGCEGQRGFALSGRLTHQTTQARTGLHRPTEHKYRQPRVTPALHARGVARGPSWHWQTSHPRNAGSKGDTGQVGTYLGDSPPPQTVTGRYWVCSIRVQEYKERGGIAQPRALAELARDADTLGFPPMTAPHNTRRIEAMQQEPTP